MSGDREHPDPRPVEWPVNLRRPPTIVELIQQHIRGHVSQLAAAEGYETEEEANDFDVGEDLEPFTAHEIMGGDVELPDASQAELDGRGSTAPPAAEPLPQSAPPAPSSAPDNPAQGAHSGTAPPSK